MNHDTTWWEELFEGDLSHGIDKEKFAKLESESFLYFSETVEEEQYRLPVTHTIQTLF